MADNVDLMVVGASDGLSAEQLTKKLVAEFNQPAEAFIELVAAACLGEPAYAAQSAVSLDTAVEGQMQLENLGVVCKLLMDGEELGPDGRQPAAPASVSANPETAVEKLPASDEKPVAETASLDDVEELKIEQESIADDDTVTDKEAEPEVSADLEDVVEFENDLEAGSALDDSVAIDTSDQNSDASTEESSDVNFQDELGSLDDELQRVSNARESKKAEAAAESEEKVEASPEPDAVSESSEEATDENAADVEVNETQDVAEPTTAAGEELELSLSVDDSQPLTKPKTKSNKIADDGGLTLSLDDDAPLSTPKKAAAAEQPSDGGLTLSLEGDDSTTVDDSKPPTKTQEKTDQSAAQVEAIPDAEGQDSETDLTGIDEKSAAEPEAARDTSREKTEEIAPVLDEPEPQKPETTPESESKPKQNTQAASVAAEEEKPASSEQVESIDPAPAPEPLTSIDSLIEDITSNAGGLVLPGQSTSEVADSAETNPEAVMDNAAASNPVVAESAMTAVDKIDVVPLASGTENSDDDEDDRLEALAPQERKSRLLKMATAATLAVGLVGGGAAYYLLGGASGSGTSSPAVAVAVPAVNKNAALEAVEEVSLNAAIERSSDISNPNNYSTEELIVYLSKDLGANAKKELQNYVNGGAEPNLGAALSPVPRMGPAIPADSNSVLWLKNRVAHSADKYFDEWAKREVALQAYMELQERLIDVGDLEIARGISSTTADRLFTVMSLQRLARSYSELGHSDKAMDLLASASRGTYGIESQTERVIAIADYAFTEESLGLKEDALDTFLKASILARSLRKPESRTVALSSIAEYYQRVERADDAKDYLELAMTTAYELPVNTAARDLAIRHVALTEVKLGLTAQATEHANLIVDPFAAVSTLHGIALELERTGDHTNASLTLNMAYRAGSLIKNSEKREKLLEKIKLAGG